MFRLDRNPFYALKRVAQLQTDAMLSRIRNRPSDRTLSSKGATSSPIAEHLVPSM
jgi:hypothetical protein